MALQKLDLGVTTGDKKGDGAKDAGEKINYNFEYLETKIDNLNQILVNAGYALAGNVLTINPGWQWKINGINYTNPVAVEFTIPFAAIGKKRSDIIAMNTSNTFAKLVGAETTGIAVTPTAVAQTILLDVFNVTESNIHNTKSAAPFLGSITPASVPTGLGSAYWNATQAGTYTNFGGVVVSANSFAVISRNEAGVFSVSQTALNLTDYAKTSDLSSYTTKDFVSGIISDYSSNFTSGAIPKVGAETDSNPLWQKSGYIPVKEGDNIILFAMVVDGIKLISYYTAENSASNVLNKDVTINLDAPTEVRYLVPSGVNFVRVCINNGTYSNIYTPSFKIIKTNDNVLSLLEKIKTIKGEFVYPFSSGAIPKVGAETNSDPLWQKTGYIPVKQGDVINLFAMVVNGIKLISYYTAENSASNVANEDVTISLGAPTSLRRIVPSGVNFVRVCLNNGTFSNIYTPSFNVIKMDVNSLDSNAEKIQTINDEIQGFRKPLTVETSVYLSDWVSDNGMFSNTIICKDIFKRNIVTAAPLGEYFDALRSALFSTETISGDGFVKIYAIVKPTITFKINLNII